MPHPVVHFEIGCQDKEKTSSFYRSVFGWAIDSGPMGIIETGSASGIPGHIASLGHEPHQFTHCGRVARQGRGRGWKDDCAAGADTRGNVCLVRGRGRQRGGSVEADAQRLSRNPKQGCTLSSP